MTLQAPIDKEGGQLAILMRDAQGDIMPPEQRAPKRVKAGMVPRELAAIAMKALARRLGANGYSVRQFRLGPASVVNVCGSSPGRKRSGSGCTSPRSS